MDENAPQRQDTPALPSLVNLIEFRWKWRGELYNASEIPGNYVFGTEPLERVVLPTDPHNFVILSPLKRGHRRYRSDDELSDDSYYVGIEGGLFTPVFIRGRGRRSSPDMNNAYCGVLLGMGSTNQTARLIIPPVDMLRPRQLTFLKVLSLGTDYHPSNEPAFRQVSEGERNKFHTDQQENFLSGQRCTVLVEDTMSGPDYNVFKHMTEDNWELFHLKMPKLVNMKIPNGLVDEIKSFLVKYPQDIVPINLAVSVAIVWSAYYNSPQYQPELAVSKYWQEGETTARKDRPVPPVELAVFILYSTHYFRIHEEHELSAYAHIFRIISCMYKKDKSFDAAFEINIEDIDHKLVLLYVSAMKIKDEDWAEIVPPSFEGSRIPMPKNYGTREPPSQELTSSLMMPHIYTLGFSGYTNEVRPDHGGVTRDIMMHGSWVPKHVLASTCWKPLGEEHLDANSLEPYHDQEPRQLWTAPQTVVRLPWPDINTVDTPHPTHLLREALSSTAATTAAIVNSSLNSPAARKPNAHDSVLRAFTDYFSLHVADLRMAKKAGFISKEVTLGPDGHLTWPNQPKRPRETPALPCEINIKKLIADDATAAKDRISGRDLVILRTILEEDLASGKHVADCLRTIKMIDVNDANLSKRRVKTTFMAAVESILKAMNRVLDYSSSVRTGGWDVDDFMNNLVRPCCELLGLDASGSLSECKDAIHSVESSLQEAIVNVEFIVRYQRENAESPFKIAMNIITDAPCFRYIQRLFLFNMRLCGQRFNEDDKKLWAEMFGEPFDDTKGGN
ncbi:hypothetical protein CGRA01v4_07743 [Colletotrichum graminicola]|uniref:Uncharacterized protein n=1 Tax=Colletotrichum graminicola (strain M1.001 / M2 / FGSC 10212) TaxID=645133 RepID=E3QPP1_COLGM|nr:uncharacterized protein GLRG_07962 [Colletotrichum graminicola M1.001]EFQ32818.1 hypothetical protein GLRG_07962 [Colletotrichum graminicola M1.001]WDK16460.1 hypothetical protein CGRA01v4_07743 [Colletotrichum graminicola]